MSQLRVGSPNLSLFPRVGAVEAADADMSFALLNSKTTVVLVCHSTIFPTSYMQHRFSHFAKKPKMALEYIQSYNNRLVIYCQVLSRAPREDT
jgi:hypothetical protein